MTKHSWRPPASSRNKGKSSNKSNKSERAGRNRWLKYVTDSHLEWLMDTVDRQRRGVLMSDEDAEHYTVIKEQAETFMAQAEAGNWSEADKRIRMLAWHGSNIVVRQDVTP